MHTLVPGQVCAEWHSHISINVGRSCIRNAPSRRVRRPVARPPAATAGRTTSSRNVGRNNLIHQQHLGWARSRFACRCRNGQRFMTLDRLSSLGLRVSIIQCGESSAAVRFHCCFRIPATSHASLSSNSVVQSEFAVCELRRCSVLITTFKTVNCSILCMCCCITKIIMTIRTERLLLTQIAYWLTVTRLHWIQAAPDLCANSSSVKTQC